MQEKVFSLEKNRGESSIWTGETLVFYNRRSGRKLKARKSQINYPAADIESFGIVMRISGSAIAF